MSLLWSCGFSPAGGWMSSSTAPGRSTGSAPSCWRSSLLWSAVDLTNKGPLGLLSGFQTPAAIRGLGVSGLQAWLVARKVRGAAALARAAVQAAQSQSVVLPGESL